MNTQGVGRQAERGGNGTIKLILGAIGLVLIVFLILEINKSAKASVITCEAPPGYEVISQTMAKNLAGQPFYIAKAIVSFGDGAVGKSGASIPACVSKDTSLQTVGGVFALLDDGRMIFIASGVIGTSATPLPETPQQ